MTLIKAILILSLVFFWSASKLVKTDRASFPKSYYALSKTYLGVRQIVLKIRLAALPCDLCSAVVPFGHSINIFVKVSV